MSLYWSGLDVILRLTRLGWRQASSLPQIQSAERKRKGLRWFAHDLALKCGYEIRRWPHPCTHEGALAAVLHAWHINCVIDVGANRGQFALLLRRLGYTGRIVSIEPGAEAFKALEALAATDKDWLALRIALGSKPGKIKLHITSSDSLSSPLPPTAYARIYFPETSQVVRTEEVSMSTLALLFNEFVKGIPNPCVFLKVDTQGYDFEVLKGAEPVLSRISILHIEVAFVPLYNGVPLWHEVISWCESHGFGLYGLFPVLRDPKGHLVEADVILVRTQEKYGNINEH
jgi:FkbM family methyltransferase